MVAIPKILWRLMDYGLRLFSCFAACLNKICQQNLLLFQIASVVHFSIFFMATWCAMALRSRQLLHSTYKMFLLSVFLHVSIQLLEFLSL